MDASRLVRVQGALLDRGLDVLLLTHPPNIRYLTGLAVSVGALLVAKQRSTLVVDGRYATAARAIVGQPPGRLALDIAVVATGGSIDETLAGILSAHPASHLSVGIEAEQLTVARYDKLGAAAGTPARWTLVSTSGIVEELRVVKDAAELSVLREAGRRLSAVARRARDFAREGRTELEVAAEIDAAVRAAGFERAAFETIVASGPNAALPHARPTSRPLTRGDGVVLDFGGVYDGYCVDLTRTLHLGPEPPEFRRLFAAVRDARAAAIASVRPGALPSAIDAAARSVLEARGFGDAFTHGTGHGLGLEVHEAPRVTKTSTAGPVTAGMVFTIEPGAYVPGTGGVRIEDDVLVVEGGCELLTDVPIEL